MTGFRTKLDYSDNRQIRQTEKTNTILSGGTTFGLPFNALTSGPDPDFSGVSETQVNIVSTFSGNTGTTVFTWYDPRMELGTTSLSAFTGLNSGTTQNTNNIWTADTFTTVDGNLVNLSYSGVNFDVTVVSMVSLGGINYSGTVTTDNFQVLSATSLDYTGRTIWVDVSGITRTNDLIINNNPQIGYVWTCADTEGKGSWSASTGGGGASGDTIYTADGTISGTRTITTNGDIIWRRSPAVTGDMFKTLLWSDLDNTKVSLHFKTEDHGPIPVTDDFAYAKFGFIYSGDSSAFGTGDMLMCINAAANSASASTTDVAIKIASNKDVTVYQNLVLPTVGAGPSTIDIGVNASGFVVNTASDITLKENIITIDSALQKINNLRGVYFNWKDRAMGGDTRKIGFIAQEVELIAPELVYTHDDGLKTVHYKDVTALLVEAVKELSSGVTTSNNTHLETQTILAEDNNIELNYSGNSQTAIGGGLRVLHALGLNQAAELLTDSDGTWMTNNDFKANGLIIPRYTPESSMDANGNTGYITMDDDYIYIKTKNGWKRTNLESF